LKIYTKPPSGRPCKGMLMLKTFKELEKKTERNPTEEAFVNAYKDQTRAIDKSLWHQLLASPANI